MRGYTFTIFRKLLCATLVLSLLWPDLAKCMEEESEGSPKLRYPSISLSLLPKDASDQQGNFTSTEKQLLPSLLKEDKNSAEASKNVAKEETLPNSQENDNSLSEKIKDVLSKDENSSTTTLPTTSTSETNTVSIEDESSEKNSLESKILSKDNSSHESKNKEEKEEREEHTETNLSQTTTLPIESEPNKEGENKGNNPSENPSKGTDENESLEEALKMIEEKEDPIDKIPSQSSMAFEETEDRKNEGKDNTNNSSANLENTHNHKDLFETIEENEDSNKEHDDKGKEEKEEVGQNDNSTPSSQENPNSISFPMGEEDEEEFLILNPENQSSQKELEEISDLETVSLLNEGHLQENFLKETPSLKALRLLRINPQNLTEEELAALDKMMSIEGTWRNPLVWSNLEILIHKALFALTTNKSTVNKRKQKKCCSPLWLHGGPVPLEDKSAIKRNVTLKTLGSALEEGITEPINTILIALMGYQIYKLIDQKKWVFSPKSIVDFYFNTTDSVSYLAIIKSLHDHPVLFALLGIPLGFTAAKTLWSVSHISEPTEDAVSESIKDIKKRSLKWDGRFFNILYNDPQNLDR